MTQCLAQDNIRCVHIALSKKKKNGREHLTPVRNCGSYVFDLTRNISVLDEILWR